MTFNDAGELGKNVVAAGLPPTWPAFGNFLYAETGADTRPLFEALLAEGVIVRPLHGFGAPTAIRVSCGTADENEFFAQALARARPGAAGR